MEGTTIVVDASALAWALVGRGSRATDLRQRLTADECHAPHLIDAEVGSVLRRWVLSGELSADVARELLEVGPLLIDHRYQMTGPLAEAAWARRTNLTFSDGLYVALAVALSVPLVTADERLAGAPDLGCAVDPV